MRCNYYLRCPKNGRRSAIYMSATYRGQRCIFFPGESIDTSHWINDKKRRINKPKPIAENNALIGRLNRFEQLVRDTHDELQKNIKGVVPAEQLEKVVIEKIRPSSANESKPITIADLFQTLIDDSRNKKRLKTDGGVMTEETIETYEVTQKHFVNFQAKGRRVYKVTDLNQKLIDNFSDYLNITLKMAFNGSGKYMKTFRTMMNYAKRKKLISVETLIETKVTVTKETPDNIYLTEQEITDMMDLKEFASTLYETIRDYFVIGCKTGLRFSDYSKINNARIDNGFIYLAQKKTQGRVTIPVHPLVSQIFAKYPGGKLPKCPSNQVFNRYLKDIGKILPALHVDFEKTITRSRVPDPQIYQKWQLLQTHSARRSFATNEYLAGTPTTTIMAITGHKTEKSFRSYIKADSLQHAMVLRDRWQAKGK